MSVEEVETYLSQSLQNDLCKTEENIFRAVDEMMRKQLAEDSHLQNVKGCSLCYQFVRPHEVLPIDENKLEIGEIQKNLKEDEMIEELLETRKLKWKNNTHPVKNFFPCMDALFFDEYVPPS